MILNQTDLKNCKDKQEIESEQLPSSLEGASITNYEILLLQIDDPTPVTPSKSSNDLKKNLKQTSACLTRRRIHQTRGS